MFTNLLGTSSFLQCGVPDAFISIMWMYSAGIIEFRDFMIYYLMLFHGNLQVLFIPMFSPVDSLLSLPPNAMLL